MHFRLRTLLIVLAVGPSFVGCSHKPAVKQAKGESQRPKFSPKLADDAVPKADELDMATKDQRWTVTIAGGLNAFFKQAGGPSKPGTDWAAVLRRGSDEKRILVRTYCDESLQGSSQQASRAREYVMKLLIEGWNPEGFTGFLTVPDEGSGRKDAVR